MDIERERGITIKAQNVRMPWTSPDRRRAYVLNMIDTPGHVDFTYEVSAAALAACEGAVLLVDAAQGIEAQTLANLYLAIENDLMIIPVLNKIDLPAAQPDLYAAELAAHHRLRARRRAAGLAPRPGFRASPSCWTDRPRCRPRSGDADAPARAMIFDSVYDIYRGVVTYVRVVDGHLHPARADQDDVDGKTPLHELLEIGVISPGAGPDQRAWASARSAT